MIARRWNELHGRGVALLCAAFACLLALCALCSCQPAKDPQVLSNEGNSSKDVHKIAYKLNGGTMPEGAPVSIQEGATVDVSEVPAPTRKGYRFLGWYKDKDCTKKATVLEGTKERKDRLLVAKWKPRKYTITYVTLGGLMPDETVRTYTVKSKDIVFDTPTRARFDFQGWYTDASFTNEVSGLKKGSTGNRTYYAKWKMIPGDNYFFSQNDKSSDWWSLKYWGGQHIGGSGCGLIVYTMAIDILTNVNMTPTDMYYMRGGEKGSWKGGDATPNSKRGTGITHKEWSEQNFGVTMRTTESYPSNATLAEGLKKGHVYLVTRGGNKCFKDKAGTWHYHAGHYVVLYRYDEATDTFYVHDPSGNTVEQQKLNQAVPYSAKDMRRMIKSRSFTICEMWVKEGMDATAQDLALYEEALAAERGEAGGEKDGGSDAAGASDSSGETERKG